MNMLKKGLLGTALGFGLVSVAADHLCLIHSETDSLPYRTFLMLKKVTPQKGQYTCYESQLYGQKIIKEIAGTSGDKLTYDQDGALWVGHRKIGKPKRRRSNGRILTPIAAGVIPEGYVFLKGDHTRSFDSRYQELGLVPQKALQGRLIGLV